MSRHHVKGLGMRKSERLIYKRLLRGPAAMYILMHLTRCNRKSVKVYISRLRRKLPAGEKIPVSRHESDTYSLERGKLTSSRVDARNKMLRLSIGLPAYTLCEQFAILLRNVKELTRAIVLRSPSIPCLKWGTA